MGTNLGQMPAAAVLRLLRLRLRLRLKIPAAIRGTVFLLYSPIQEKIISVFGVLTIILGNVEGQGISSFEGAQAANPFIMQLLKKET